MGSPRQASAIVFIVNPKAGTRSSDLLEGQIERNLDQSRFRYSLLYTEHPGHGLELARSAVDNKAAAVIAVGGDGTMNECATALIGSNTILGLIPMGSGNGLARDLGIPLEIPKSIHVINGFTCRTIDCGVVNGNYFFCTAGVGFDAWISRKFQQQKGRGFRGYMNTAIKEFSRYRSSTYTVEFNHTRKQVKAFSITMANSCQFGNNAFISPEADPGDGFIDLCIVKAFPKHHVFAMARRLFNGTIHRSRFTEIYRVKKACIQCPGDIPCHIDGEARMVHGGELNFETLPGALRILVP